MECANVNANGEVFIKSLPLATRHKPVAFFAHQGRLMLTRALLHGGRLPIVALADRWTGKWALTTPTEERRELVGCWHLPSYVYATRMLRNQKMVAYQKTKVYGQLVKLVRTRKFQMAKECLWASILGMLFFLQCLM
jgi:hypothetical protein